MPAAPLPENESARLKALRDYKVLDSTPEQAYDDIVRLASYICKTPMAVITLIDSNRQWFKSKVGLEGTETSRDVAFCAHAILQPGEMTIVPDATKDARFADNPLVTGSPDIRFYAGAPLVTAGGEALGTLCVVDSVPKALDPGQLDALRTLSREVMVQLELRRSIETLESTILDHEQYVRQMEQAHAVLEAESVTDALTGVKNRRAFQSRADWRRSSAGPGAMGLRCPW